jgi:hypothetical protein
MVRAFGVAAGELGFAAASWLFVREAAAESGDPGVDALRDELGRSFPVLDAVASAWLEGLHAPHVDVEPVLQALRGAQRVLVVGIEADHLDALVERIDPSIELALLQSSVLGANWERVLANYGGRIRGTDLASFHTLTGARSAALTFVYGNDGHHTHVRPSWLRFMGPDVRTQFRSLIGWDALPGPLYVYPRWLHQMPVAELTAIVPA